MGHDGDDVFEDDDPDTIRDTVEKKHPSLSRGGDADTLRDTIKTTSPLRLDDDRHDTLRDMAGLTVPFDSGDDDVEEIADTLEMSLPSALTYTNLVFDDGLLDHDEAFIAEERQTIETGIQGFLAHIVFRDDELAFLELEWSQASGHVFPASTEMVDAIHAKAARMGYPLSLLLRRAMATPDGSRFVERHIVVFRPEPVDGDGTGLSIELQLGLDLDDEDYGRPAQAEKLRDQWVERVTDLVKVAYPRAQLNTLVCDYDANEVHVTSPLGIDETDFEWRIEDLIDLATDAVIDGSQP